MKFCVLILGVAWCCVLGGVSMVDIADDVSNQSEMSGILGVLMKDVNMHSALKFVKQYKQESGILTELMKMSPFFRQLFDDAGKSNAATKVALDILRGHIPTLKDLVHLVHNTGPNVAVQSAIAHSKPFQELQAVMNTPNYENTRSVVEQSLFLLVGYHLNLQSVFTLDPSTGKYHIVDTPGNKYWNLVQCNLFMHDNWGLVVDALENKNESYPVALLQAVLKWNYTHLSLIHGSALDGPKYSVSGIGTRNQDVVDIIRSVKKYRALINKNSTFEDLQPIIGVTSKLFHVFSTSIQEAVSASSQVVG